MFLFRSNATSFGSRGLGSLKEATRCEVTEIINGMYELYMEYPVDGVRVADLVEDNIIYASTPTGEQPFRIYGIKKDLAFYRINASHIFYDLEDNLIEDINIVNMNGAGALDKIIKSTQYPNNFTAFSDIPTLANSRIVRKNVTGIILDTSRENSFLNRWGGEIERDKFTVKMLQQRGQNRGVKIKYRKNMMGIDLTLNHKTTCTRIMPIGYDGLLLPEKYVDSPLINKYQRIKIKTIEFPDVIAINPNDQFNPEGAVPLEEAYTKLRQKSAELFSASHIDVPETSCKVNVMALQDTEEFKSKAILEKIYPFDIVTIYHEKLGINITMKMNSYTWNSITNKYIYMDFGSIKNNIVDTITAVEDIKNTIDSIEQSFLDKAKEDATGLINQGLGGYVVKTREEILIMDTDDVNTASKIWRWNKNGLGYSSTGYNGQFGLAMTSDGRIVADFITSGVLNASLIKAGILKSFNNKTWINMEDGSFNFADKIKFENNVFSLTLQNGQTVENYVKGEITGGNQELTEILNKIQNVNIVTVKEKVELKEKWSKMQSEYVNTISLVNSFNPLVNGSITTEYTRIYNVLDTTFTEIFKSMGIDSNIDGTALSDNIVSFYNEQLTIMKALDLVTIQINNNLTTLSGKVTEITSDTKFTPNEKISIKKEIETIKIVYAKNLEIATSLSCDGTLINNYTSAYDKLLLYINPLLANMTTTSTIDQVTFQSKFTDYAQAEINLTSTFNTKLQSLITQAEKQAEEAKKQAKLAIDELGFLSNDSKITPSEKLRVDERVKEIKAEYPSIIRQADLYGISTVFYKKSYDTLNDYCYNATTGILRDLTTTTDIDRTIYLKNFNDYYSYRQTLLEDVVKKANDKISVVEQDYLDIKTSIQGLEVEVGSLKSELAVNILKNGDFKKGLENWINVEGSLVTENSMTYLKTDSQHINNITCQQELDKSKILPNSTYPFKFIARAVPEGTDTTLQCSKQIYIRGYKTETTFDNIGIDSSAGKLILEKTDKEYLFNLATSSTLDVNQYIKIVFHMRIAFIVMGATTASIQATNLEFVKPTLGNFASIESVAKLQIQADSISATVTKNKTEIDGKVSALESNFNIKAESIEATVKENKTAADGAISNLDSKITQTATEINSTVTANKKDADGKISSAQSSISQLSNQIATKVDVNGVKSTIQQNPDSIKIGFNQINNNFEITPTEVNLRDTNGIRHTALTNGRTYYYDKNNYVLSSLGSTSWSGVSTMGLGLNVFRQSFMAFSYYNDATITTTPWLYFNFNGISGKAFGIHLGKELYCNNYKVYSPKLYFGDDANSACMYQVGDRSLYINGASNKDVNIYGGNTGSPNMCFNETVTRAGKNLDMNGYSIFGNYALVNDIAVNNLSLVEETSAFNTTSVTSKNVTKAINDNTEWIGEAEIINGKCVIDLPEDILYNSYHVFLTPIGRNTLYLIEKNDDSFTVECDKDCTFSFLVKFLYSKPISLSYSTPQRGRKIMLEEKQQQIEPLVTEIPLDINEIPEKMRPKFLCEIPKLKGEDLWP